MHAFGKDFYRGDYIISCCFYSFLWAPQVGTLNTDISGFTKLRKRQYASLHGIGFQVPSMNSAIYTHTYIYIYVRKRKIKQVCIAVLLNKFAPYHQLLILQLRFHKTSTSVYYFHSHHF